MSDKRKDWRRRFLDWTLPICSLRRRHLTVAASMQSTASPYSAYTLLGALFYILSGVSQPLLMTLCKQAGLADPTAQVYMVFYYAGPSLLIIPIIFQTTLGKDTWPGAQIILQAAGIAGFDIVAQALNYTGASLAGPTLFAIVYSSVTMWTAVFSRIVLKRRLVRLQWWAVALVFGGLVLTATSSIELGPKVAHGTLIIVLGSCMHAATYVWSEVIMLGPLGLSPQQNSAIQGFMALTVLTLWQVFYTWPRRNELIIEPSKMAQTSLIYASVIMMGFGIANLIHSVTFYHTIKHYPGGATSAGVMKGLQAVLVFVAAHLAYCGRLGGTEMCFTPTKFLSLITVVGGVVLFSWATEPKPISRDGYEVVESAVEVI
jgi:drug/metabolite transporter (DMT)-like permease